MTSSNETGPRGLRQAPQSAGREGGRARERADAQRGGAVSTPVGGAMPQAAEAAQPGAAPEAGGPGGLPAGIAVEIRLLGRFVVLRGPEEVPLRAFGGRRAQQLLRLLALRRGALVPKDVIAEALWPKQCPADAAGNVEVLVSRIRRALGDRTLIRTGSGGYSLAAGSRCWVDTEAFLAAVQTGRKLLAERPVEALAPFRSALEIWQGEPLAEDTYAEWAQEDRRHLGRALLEALDGAAAAALACGGPAEALTWAERALASAPLREASAMLAVRALAAGGDQAGALAAFDSFRRSLAQEAGLDPSPEALRLRQRILCGQPVPLAPAGEAARPPVRLPEPGPFVGRREECATILAAAADYGPRLVLVTGPRGVGKSRLLAEAAGRARVPVLGCQAYPPDRHEAWSVAGRLLRQARRVAGADVMLPDREARALASLVPGLAVAASAHSIGGDEQDRAFALQGAVRLVEAATRPRCLIVVDDLQWADPASLELLGLLLRRIDWVSMVAAHQQHDLAAMPLASFALPAEQVSHLPLGPLPADAVRGLVGDRTLAEVILGQAERTPLAVTEVIAALTRDGAILRDQQGRWRLRTPGDAAHARSVVAAGQRQAAQDRLDRLPGRWRELLALLALLGRPAPPGLLAEACGWAPQEVLDCLDGLARADLARPGWRGWRLRHQLLGEAQVGTLVPAERALAHALLARALELGGADAAEVAAHRAASGDRDGACVAYAAAAARRLERLADAEAIGLAEAGLSLEPAAAARALLLDARAEVYWRRGLLDEARADLTAVLESCDDAAGRSCALAELAILEARSVSVVRGEALVRLAVAEARGRPGPLGQALAAGAIIDLPAGNLGRANRQFRQARQLLDEAGETQGSARLLYWRAMISYMAGQLREAVERLGDLAYLPVQPAEVLRLWSPRATRGHVLALLGDPEAGLAEIKETLGWAEAAGYPAMRSECLWRRSEALAFEGRAGEAVESAEQALAIGTQLRHAACTAAALRGLGIAWDAAGDAGRAEQAFRRSVRAAEGNPFFAAWASARLGACLARQGRPEDAALHVRAALSAGPPLTRYEARWARAELLAARCDHRASRAAAEALRAAHEVGYQILVPRLRELAGRAACHQTGPASADLGDEAGPAG